MKKFTLFSLLVFMSVLLNTHAQISFSDYYHLPHTEAFMIRSGDMNNDGKQEIVSIVRNGNYLETYIHYQGVDSVIDSILFVGQLYEENPYSTRSFALQDGSIQIATNGNGGTVFHETSPGHYASYSMDLYSSEIGVFESSVNFLCAVPVALPNFTVITGGYFMNYQNQHANQLFRQASISYIDERDSLLYSTHQGGVRVYKINTAQFPPITLQNSFIQASSSSPGFFRPETMAVNDSVIFQGNTHDGSYRLRNKNSTSITNGVLPYAPGINSAWVDLDGDSIQELVNYKDDKLYIYKNIGALDIVLYSIVDVPLERPSLHSGGSNYYFKHALSVGDYNSNGKQDIALSTQEGVVVLYNQTQSVMTEPDSSVSHISYTNVIDTLYDTVYDTLLVEVFDTSYTEIIDTTYEVVIDTLYEVVTDTVVVHDTSTIEVYDTIAVIVIDTLYESLYDSVVVEIFDTSYTEIIDTTYEVVIDTLYEVVTDTVVVHDTSTVEVYDTISVTVIDTLYEIVHDSVLIEVYDTITVSVFDTLYETVYDSVTVEVYDTLFIEQEIISSVDFHSELTLSVYPNPAEEIIYIKNNDFIKGEYFEIYSMSGQKVQSGLFDKSIQINHLASGVYVLKFNNASPVKFKIK